MQLQMCMTIISLTEATSTYTAELEIAVQRQTFSDHLLSLSVQILLWLAKLPQSADVKGGGWGRPQDE